jgi:hypothetical protein
VASKVSANHGLSRRAAVQATSLEDDRRLVVITNKVRPQKKAAMRRVWSMTVVLFACYDDLRTTGEELCSGGVGGRLRGMRQVRLKEDTRA